MSRVSGGDRFLRELPSLATVMVRHGYAVEANLILPRCGKWRRTVAAARRVFLGKAARGELA